MVQQQLTDRPRFTSISVYNHSQGHLSFWYPTEWQIQEIDSPHLTISLLPLPIDPATNITIEIRDFPGPLEASDHESIADGVKEGLTQLTEVALEYWCELGTLENSEIQTGTWGLEWICTFVDEGEHRKRRARLFFTRSHMYSVICQGRNEDDYRYWQGMFEYVLLTVGSNQFSAADWAAQQERDHP